MFWLVGFVNLYIFIDDTCHFGMITFHEKTTQIQCTETQNIVTMAEQLDDKEIQEILKTGTDLRQYSRQIEKEFKEVENKSIEDYIKESQNIANLHNQIGNCDTILERMESMLLNFQVGKLLCNGQSYLNEI